MKILIAVIAATVLASPMHAQIVGPNGDRYEIRVAKTKAIAYGTAMTVLSDSIFTTKEASLDAGVIQTEWRKPGAIAPRREGLGSFLKRRISTEKPVRLNVVLVPIGADSTRIVLTGDENWENIDKVTRVNTDDEAEWRVLKSVGDAILSGLK